MLIDSAFVILSIYFLKTVINLDKFIIIIDIMRIPNNWVLNSPSVNLIEAVKEHHS